MTFPDEMDRKLIEIRLRNKKNRYKIMQNTRRNEPPSEYTRKVFSFRMNPQEESKLVEIMRFYDIKDVSACLRFLIETSYQDIKMTR